MEYINKLRLRDFPYFGVIIYGVVIAIINPATAEIIGRTIGGLIALFIIRHIWKVIQEKADLGIYSIKQYNYLTVAATIMMPLGALLSLDINIVYNMAVSYLYTMMYFQFITAPIAIAYNHGWKRIKRSFFQP